MDTAGHMRTRRGPDVSRGQEVASGQDVVHHRCRPTSPAMMLCHNLVCISNLKFMKSRNILFFRVLALVVLRQRINVDDRDLLISVPRSKDEARKNVRVRFRISGRLYWIWFFLHFAGEFHRKNTQTELTLTRITFLYQANDRNKLYNEEKQRNKAICSLLR